MRCPVGVGSEEQRGSSTAPYACKRANRTPGFGGGFAACGSALCREPSTPACEPLQLDFGDSRCQALIHSQQFQQM